MFRPMRSRIGDEVAVHCGRQLDRDPQRFVLDDRTKLQRPHVIPPRGRRLQFEMMGAAIGVDHQVGGDVGPHRLHQDIRKGAGTARRIADDPARRVAGRNRPGAGKLLAGLERYVGDLAGCGVELIQWPSAKGYCWIALTNPSRAGCTRAAAFAAMTRSRGQVRISERCVGWRESAVEARLRNPIFYSVEDGR